MYAQALKRIVLSSFLVLVIGFSFNASAALITIERPAGYVNDFSDVLPQKIEDQLEVLLLGYEQKTSNEIVVVIAKSFEGRDAFSYSQELFTSWGVGKKSKNNGILIVLGPREGLPFPQQGDIFINVGRGLEGVLPDSLTGTIIRREMVPFFKKGEIANGLFAGVAAIIESIQGEYKAENPERQKGTALSDSMGFLIWIGFFIVSYIGSFLARTKSWWLGGAMGGVGGLVLGLFLLTGAWILLSAVGLGLAGLLFDFIVSRNYEYRRAHGKPTDFWHSRGGFWWGGGRGGGGFGGFGGGISGGGGAGGRW